MSNLVGFDDAPVYERLPGFEKGSYVAKIIELTRFASSNDDGEYFKATLEIVEAAPGSGNVPGDQVAEVLPLFGKWKKTFYGKVKSIIGAATHEKATKITMADFDEAVSPDNPCAGALVKVYAAPAEKKDSKESYVRSTFMPYGAANQETVQ